MKTLNFVRNELDIILLKQNYNKVFSVDHLLIGGDPANDTPIASALLLYYLKSCWNNFLQVDDMRLLSGITNAANKGLVLTSVLDKYFHSR